MRKAYIHKAGDSIAVSVRNHVPKDVLCECPKDEHGNYVIDLELISLKEGSTGGWVAEINESAMLNKVKKTAEGIKSWNESNFFERLKSRLF